VTATKTVKRLSKTTQRWSSNLTCLWELAALYSSGTNGGASTNCCAFSIIFMAMGSIKFPVASLDGSSSPRYSNRNFSLYWSGWICVANQVHITDAPVTLASLSALIFTKSSQTGPISISLTAKFNSPLGISASWARSGSLGSWLLSDCWPGKSTKCMPSVESP